MSDRLGNFGDFGGRVWLDTANQGALPLPAAREARRAIECKLVPSRLPMSSFEAVPSRLRAAIGRLLDVPPHEVILANSASYGLNLVAQAFPWESGDEVLVVAGDFPSDILPWLVLEERYGVRVRRIRPAAFVLRADELATAIGPQTRLLCTSWVHSFSGHTIDVERLGGLCRERGVCFLLNASQGLGAAPFHPGSTPVDGIVSTGFKWLCGPYGTGLCWLRPELLERLHPTKAYWLAMQSPEELGAEVGDAQLVEGLGAPAFDVFGTANFLNFLPFAAAIEHLLEIGIERIRAHDQALVQRFVRGLPAGYRLLSPREGPSRSTLVFFSHREPGRNRSLVETLREEGIDLSLRNGALRIAPHLYNGSAEVDRLLSALEAFAASERPMAKPG